MNLEDSHPNPQTCEYITVEHKRDFEDAVTLTTWLSGEELAQYHLMGPQRPGKESRSVCWREDREVWHMKGTRPTVGSLEDRGLGYEQLSEAKKVSKRLSP